MSDIEIKTSFEVLSSVYPFISPALFIQLFQSRGDEIWKLWLNCKYNIYVFLDRINGDEKEKFYKWLSDTLKTDDPNQILKKACCVCELIFKKFNVGTVFSVCNTETKNHLEIIWNKNRNIAVFISVLGQQLKNTMLLWAVKHVNTEYVDAIYKSNRTPIFHNEPVVEPKKQVQTTSISGYGIRNIGKRKQDNESILPKGVRNFQQLSTILGQN